MRIPRALVIALVVLALTPGADAATFDLGASKIVERALEPGADAVFEMPLKVNQDGFLYGKVLPTPGNAVNDGSRANGSLVDGSGWRVTFALVRESGERVEMGTYVDSTVSALVPIANGEHPTFVATVHVPKDAARGGPQQNVYVAVAYRLSSASGGASSGGVIDEAKALTLLLSNALLPPAAVVPSASGDSATPDATDTGTGTGVGTGPGADTGTGTGTGTDTETEIPTVGPIDESSAEPVRVYVEALPGWFLAGALVLGGGLLVVLGFMTAAIYALAKARTAEAKPPAARSLAVEREAGARVQVFPAREE